MAKVRLTHCLDWRELKATLFPELFDSDRFVEGRYLFRGVADEDWLLESSFDRYARDVSVGRRAQAADRLLELFREECMSDPAIDDCPGDAEEAVAVAQHYGLPTRALDWTESPYVAAFFAFADSSLTASSRTSANVAIWALDRDDDLWNGTMGASLVWPSHAANDRLLRQRGALSHLRAPQASLDAYVEACEGDDVGLWKFTVPREEAPVALADLGAMGISATRLFPDRTGAGRAALARYAGAEQPVS